ncbi:TIGR03016 family PEP-CTERM system-associated outer membrane protein [Wenzhouxiangella sp. XN24]|nr:TIGR03016 family PEP-CTERM system-associated outer membrane protein [Wenzhouxiangella sp. XN24]
MPRVSLAETWTDNVSLAADGLEDSEWITELTPGFSLTGEGARVKLTLDYDLQALWFADNSDFNDTFHQASGTGNFVLAPESLFLDAFVRLDQQNIDTSGRVGFSNLFQTNNRTDALVFGASPYHTGRYGDWAESLLRFDYRGVRYANTDATTINIEDSDTQTISGWFGSPANARGLSWRTYASQSTTDFEQAQDFRFDRVGLELGVPVGLRTRLTATGGVESDVTEDSSKGGLDASFWSAGLEWNPDELQSLRLSVGERYFGTSYGASYSRRGSRGSVELSYSEDPTTSSGLLGNDSVFQPGQRPGGSATLDTRVFLSKRFAATARYELVRSVITARIYSDRRTYEDGAGDSQDVAGATLGFDWDIAPRTMVGLSADFEQRDFDGAQGQDDYLDLSLRVVREITRTFSGTFRLAHFKRDSEVREEYSANLATLSLDARF